LGQVRDVMQIQSHGPRPSASSPNLPLTSPPHAGFAAQSLLAALGCIQFVCNVVFASTVLKEPVSGGRLPPVCGTIGGFEPGPARADAVEM